MSKETSAAAAGRSRTAGASAASRPPADERVARAVKPKGDAAAATALKTASKTTAAKKSGAGKARKVSDGSATVAASAPSAASSAAASGAGLPIAAPAKPAAPASRKHIVSSAHLASGRGAGLSEFEFGLIVAGNAFSRWAVRCIGAAGVKDMTTTDVLVLHHVNHRAREKKLGDIAFILNIEDTHVVNYSLKKLLGLGLLQTEKRGKEVLYSTNEAGQALCQRYHEIREEVLVASLAAGGEAGELGEMARVLRVLSGLYEQAARSATSF